MNGCTYVRKPVFDRLYIPFGSIPNSARATAVRYIEFLQQLKDCTCVDATTKAASMLVGTFKEDVLEMGLVEEQEDVGG